MIALDALFEPFVATSIYGELRDEWLVVAERRKPMSWFQVSPHSNLREAANTFAKSHGLAVYEWRRGDSTHLAVVVPEEGWRVFALKTYLSHVKTPPTWSDLRLKSAILGYSDEETADWIAQQKTRFAVWGPHLYFYSPSTLLPCLTTAAFRAFPMQPDLRIDTFCPHAALRPRKDAYSLIPGTYIFGRFGIEAMWWNEWLAQRGNEEPFSIVEIYSDGILDVNEALRGRIEVLTADGWPDSQR